MAFGKNYEKEFVGVFCICYSRYHESPNGRSVSHKSRNGYVQCLWHGRGGLCRRRPIYTCRGAQITDNSTVIFGLEISNLE